MSVPVSHIPETDISRLVVDCAFYIHKTIGPGLLENAYEECLSILMAQRGILFQRQVVMPLMFESRKIEIGYRLDFLIADSLIVEIKSVEKILPIHEAQLLTYMKLSKIPQGLLINFNSKMFKDGIKRFVL
jgi:GxxExxY protein